MSQPYIGEIRLFAGNFAPYSWEFCHGQLLSIAENDALFALIGTTYGGDGWQTFALPDLRSRIPVHQGAHAGGSPHIIGERSGAESVTLVPQQLPAHTHTQAVVSSQSATSRSAVGNVRAALTAGQKAYAPVGNGVQADVVMASSSPSGGSQPHENRQPYLGINYIISLFGVFPSRP